ncbi:helix-turn-helix domain-containing protein [Dysgonomonas capnocytophagoides]|uniref:helix-turn-helix domain-containing protein n=1 Tax=Dysgonomonas capnocytophagoides TaxID=45254 RepID=UPI002920AE4C|nr:hypothetical protein DCPSUM001_13720 [Dysgonomonas capnocytophagoides]
MTKSESINTEKEVLTPEEAAAFLNYKLPSIYKRTSQKTIPHSKIDGKIMFRRSRLLQWISENEVPTIGEASKTLDEKLFNKRNSL